MEEGGHLTTAALTCWFGEGPRGERPKSSRPRSVARGFTSLLVEGFLGPSVCLWPSGPQVLCTLCGSCLGRILRGEGGGGRPCYLGGMREKAQTPAARWGLRPYWRGLFSEPWKPSGAGTVLLPTGVGWGFWQGRERKQVSFSE